MSLKKIVDRIKDYFRLPEAVEEESSKIRFCKESGTTPLSDIDFEKKDVLEVDMESFQSYEKVSSLYDELGNLPYVFELYSIPTLINFEKMLGDNEITEEHKEMFKSLKDSLPKNTYKYTRVFLVANKTDGEKVAEVFKNLSFKIIGVITEEEAKEIVVG